MAVGKEIFFEEHLSMNAICVPQMFLLSSGTGSGSLRPPYLSGLGAPAPPGPIRVRVRVLPSNAAAGILIINTKHWHKNKLEIGEDGGTRLSFLTTRATSHI